MNYTIILKSVNCTVLNKSLNTNLKEKIEHNIALVRTGEVNQVCKCFGYI